MDDSIMRVCSGWHPEGSRLYGRRFLDSFDRHWDAAVELRVYVEEAEPMPRRACRILWDIPGARQCAERYAIPLTSGRAPDSKWKQSTRRRGYNFRFDAAKFWKQILIPEAASDGLRNGDILIWLDGDVVTTAPGCAARVRSLMADHDMLYLGRAPKHSEIGFWAVRITTETRIFLRSIAVQYINGDVLNLHEWHSAFVWDHERKRMAGRGFPIRQRDLTPGGSGHVFPVSPIGHFLTHDKGARKPGGSIG